MNHLPPPSRLTLLILALASACPGCDAPPIRPVLTDDDPSVKIPAIELAVQQKDRSALPVLIKALDSDDPAIRFYANDGLQKLTGQDFGFVYYEDEQVRRPAVARWRAWFEHSPDSPPVTAPPGTASAATEP
jgi:hypothetical protein